MRIYLSRVHLCLAILTYVAGSDALRVREVVVPPHKIKGSGVELLCLYELDQTEQLYSVKWYKGIREFFRYVPADSPPIQVFNVSGVNIDVEKSSSGRVVLRGVSLRTSGKYKCEVSAEAPSFHTDSGTGQLLVVHTPESDPHISGARARYHVGDMVRVNCTSSPSKPAAALMWYVNNNQADSASLIDYAPLPTPEGLETSILGLHFRADVTHLQDGHLKLRCTATIAAVYFREKTIFTQARLSNPIHRPESHSIIAGKARLETWWCAVAVGVMAALFR